MGHAGREIAIYGTGILVHLGGKPYIVGTAVDVSDRPAAEAALARSERNYREIFNAATDAMVIHGEGGVVEDINERTTSLFGWVAKTSLASAQSILFSRRRPTRAARPWKSFAWPLKRGRNSSSGRADERTASCSGAKSLFAPALSLEKAGSSPPSGTSVIGNAPRQSATAWRKACGRRRKWNRLAAWRAVSPTTSTTYSPPSAATCLYSCSVTRPRPPPSRCSRRPRAAESAANLTRQLLAFSRKQVIRPKVMCLNDVVGGMQMMLCRLVGEDVELRIKPDPELGQAEIDPGQVEQVLVNLVVNEFDAMPSGGTW